MVIGKTYIRTSDLQSYQAIRQEVTDAPGRVDGHEIVILQDLSDNSNTVEVSAHLLMATTRDWANSMSMAIGNKIKLLENEIVSLTLKRQNLRTK